MTGRRRHAQLSLFCTLAGLVLVLLASCTSDLGAEGDGTRGAGDQDACAVPRPGCPCTADKTGTLAQCGKMIEKSGDYVLCSVGQTACDGARWGECTSNLITTRHLPTLPGPSTSSLKILGLAETGPPCPVGDASDPLSNVCDPYCHQYIDDPVGLNPGPGFLNDGGGIMIAPPTDAGGDGGAVNVPFQVTANGVNTCPPGPQMVGASCNAGNQFTQCQQDHRCNIATSTCVWNGGEGWFDPTVAGVDLTIGAACESVANGQLVPVCNRGSQTLAANSVVNVHVGGATPLADSCAPGPVSCSRNVGTGGLLPGKCVSVPCAIPGDRYAAVSATPAVTEPGGRCANNQAWVKTSGVSGTCATCTTCNTRLTGTIYDPRGVNPIPNALVYVPAETPSALPTTVGCDTCVSLASGNPTTVAVTNYDGTFTLDNVPSGSPFNLVILSGRWRRQVTVPAIANCGTATLSNAQRTLPKNSGEGDIPRMAIAMAAGDHTECLMRQIGVSDSEFTNAAGTGRIHLYHLSNPGSGHTLSGTTNAATALWDNPTALQNYSAIIAPCDNTTITSQACPGAWCQPTTTIPNHRATLSQRTNVQAYLNGGGRLFASHWYAADFVNEIYPTAASHLYGKRVDDDRENPAFVYTIDQSHTAGQTFANWSNLVGASPDGFGTVTFNSWRHITETVAPTTIRFAYGDSRNAPLNRSQTPAPSTSTWGGPNVGIYGFDTPVGGTACGRVMIPMSHVTPGSNGGFPGACGSASAGMTPQQKAFEFLVFYSQACLGPPPAPVVPPPPPNLSTAYYYRDYEGVCPIGTTVKWGYFYWQSRTPSTTNIEFRAATAADPSAFAAPPPPGLPGTVPIGIAQGADVVAPAWAYNSGAAPNGTVDFHLRNDPTPRQTSQRWLRVYMKFNPSGPISPTLLGWRAQFSCEPNE